MKNYLKTNKLKEVNKMRFTLLISLAFILMFVTTFVSAENLVYVQGELADIKVPCINNNTYCSAASTCDLTVINPESVILLNNTRMTRQTAFHNYTLNTSDTATNGEYTRNVFCNDGTDNGFSSVSFFITPTGEKLSTSSSIGYGIILFIMLGVSVFFLIFSKLVENPGFKLFFILTGFIILILTIGTGVVTAQSFGIQSGAINLFSGMLFLVTLVLILIMMFILVQQFRTAVQLMKARKGFIDEDDVGF
jgi:hypothetical protein|tara:strand:- start:572 stop:1321 length:750 start_codon:yes stop_codon:yes gene_type:complete